MALSAAAPVDCCGTPALEAALPAGADDRLTAGADDEPATGTLLGMMAVELTPGTMGMAREVGAIGVTVGPTGGVTAGTETAGVETAGIETAGVETAGTNGLTEGATTLVAGGAWIWPSLIWVMGWTDC